MKTNELVAKYFAFHSHGHASQRAVSATAEMCVLLGPSPHGGVAADVDQASARDAAPVCYVP